MPAPSFESGFDHKLEAALETGSPDGICGALFPVFFCVCVCVDHLKPGKTLHPYTHSFETTHSSFYVGEILVSGTTVTEAIVPVPATTFAGHCNRYPND